MKVIDWLERGKRKELRRNGQRVACLTYTNVAVDEKTLTETALF